MRSFDPLRVGRLECDAWVTYYRRRWARFLWAAVSLTRETFGLPWPATLRGAWLVLRANQLWAPQPDNDPEGARRCMREFYALVARRHGEGFDVGEAARLEVEWWRLHRELGGQRRGEEEGELGPEERALSEAIAALYSHVYGVGRESVREAADLRTLAMRHSDRWVSDGRDPASPLIALECGELIRSYSSLRATVGRT
ncbi:MAG: hypothetical protein ACXWZM_09680 [Solirubrobacterales bacterium]